MKKFYAVLALLLAVLAIWSFTPNPVESVTHTNFARGKVTGGTTITNAATTGSTFSVTNRLKSADFPTTNFLVAVYHPACQEAVTCNSREIMLISSRSGSTFTISARNQEGTTHSADWPEYSKVDHFVTAGAVDGITSTLTAHSAATGTNVHSLGTMATQTAATWTGNTTISSIGTLATGTVPQALIPELRTDATPTFAGANFTSPLSIVSGGTGTTTDLFSGATTTTCASGLASVTITNGIITAATCTP